jgi:hypothetical protein
MVHTWAALSGRIEVLEYLDEVGFVWDEMACANAAFNGHLDALVWLRDPSRNCPLDCVCSAAAARSGHLEVLKWLRENGCPWNEQCASW